MPRRALARTPSPLLLIVGCALVLSLAWTVLQPPFQGPDESGHVMYLQRMVEQRELPWMPRGGEPGIPSPEIVVAIQIGGLESLRGNPAMKDTFSSVDERVWAQRDAQLPGGGRKPTGFSTSMRNPPLYYLYAAVPYLATYPTSIFDRLFAIRLANLPLVAIIVLCTWLLTGLIAGPRRWLQATAAAVVALNPQLSNLSATVNPDVLVATLFAIALVLMAQILLRAPRRRWVIALVAVTVATCLTHPRGIPLVAPVALTLAIAWWRTRRPHPRRSQVLATAGLAAAAVVGIAGATWAATGQDPTPDRVRGFVSYLWQFYLPRPGFMEVTLRPDWSARDVYVERFWGTFGYLDALVAPWLSDLIAAISVVGLVLLGASVAARPRALRRARGLAVVLVLAVVAYIGTIHIEGWRSIEAGGTRDPVITGRYMVVFLPLLGAAAALLVSWLPKRAALPVAVGVVFAALAMQLAALGAMVVRFHA